MNEAVELSLTAFAVAIVISFFVVLVIKSIYFALKFLKKS